MGSASSSAQDQIDCCSNCEVQFTRSTRKTRRICLECQLTMCATCVAVLAPPPPSYSKDKSSKSIRRIATGFCNSCMLMLNADSTDQQLTQLKVKHLKAFLVRRNVTEVSGCVEKRDLVELILANVGGQTYRERQLLEQSRLQQLRESQAEFDRLTNRTSPATEATTEEVIPPAAAASETHSPVGKRQRADGSSSLNSTADEQAQQRVHPADVASSGAPSVQGQGQDPPQPPRGNNGSEVSISSQVDAEVKQSSDTQSKISLAEIDSIDEVENLSVKQLKIILTRNLVNYRGCKEKHELVTKVKMLWQSRQDNQRLYEKLLNPPAAENGAPANREEVELCKICMDSAIDCVLLDCGHMVTCTKCGKQMNECPICRQYVIRAVHIFRA